MARAKLPITGAAGITLCFASALALADPFVSDDFSSPNLDPNLWTVEDPVGDAVLALSGGELSLSISNGLEHDVWTSGNMSARIMQASEDVDFTLEVKFTSVPTQRHQMQGILVEGDSQNFLRFDFLGDGSNLRLFAASFSNGSPTARHDAPIGFPGGALYMRVERSGDEWGLSYSFDGFTWNLAATFSYSVAVTRVGAFVGNAGSNPAFTGTIDYFFNAASPVVPEDGELEGPDSTAPNFFNVEVIPLSQSELSVTWSTDEPADGFVEYGLTTGYELGSSAEPELTTAHSFLLSNLQPENTYHVRFASSDEAGNTRYSDDHTVLMSALPTIDVWYGNNQAFGTIGQPQRWINVLGNVFDANGISSLTYSLNGQPEQGLSVGPDDNRLQAEGDFNVEIDYADLISGFNAIEITATDSLGYERVESVDVYYPGRVFWPDTYSIDWSNVQSIADVAQVVDGLWTLEEDAVRPVALGYDRLIAIGDVLWQNYEATVPIKVHGLDPLCSHSYCAGNSPLVGLLVRWPGHDETWRQPNEKWTPMGALGVYRFGGQRLQIYRGSNGSVGAETGASLAFGTTYLFKMRAETVGGVHRYSLKVWPEGTSEPPTWDLVLDENLSETASGSLVLVAHHVDASFGDVVVTPLGSSPPPPDTTPPVISNVQIGAATGSSVTITWQTDEPADSAVAFGESVAYEEGTVTHSALVNGHSITLSDLIADTTYHYQVRSADASGNESHSIDLTFTTPGPASGDTTPPAITNVMVSSITASQATITWQTDEPADGAVAYGLTSAYGEGSVSSPTLVTSHSLVLTGLSGGTTYHFAASSTDGSGNSSSSPDLVFTTLPAPGEVTPDEFNDPLDPGVWTWTDPVGDSSVTTSGGRLRISVPGGADHDVWTNANDAPRLRQYVINSDFEIEVKFDSAVTQQHQLQGILVEQDGGNLIRFDFYSTGSQTRSFVATFNDGIPTTLSNAVVPSTPPMYMRIKREGDLWTQWISSDGVNWTPVVSFNHPIFVNNVAVFAGNVGSPAPAHEAVIDYFRVIGGDLPPDTAPPAISNVQVSSVSASQATITWQTDEPSDSAVEYGPSSNYELGSVSNGALVTTHTIVLSGLTAETVYHYRVGSVDSSGNFSNSPDLVFTTAPEASGSLTSDDFSDPLNSAVWFFNDPLGDSSATTSSGDLVISVPAGTSHDVWTNANDAPRLRQYVTNSDFEIEVKFDSPVTQKYQLQGILVEQDDGNLIRFDFYGKNGQTRSLVSTFVDGVPTVLSDATVSPVAPMYMRVKREGDVWTQSVSSDGANWSTLVSFSHPIFVTNVSLFAGNAGSSAPAHDALIDYFHVLPQ